jgi:hypothetical protein
MIGGLVALGVVLLTTSPVLASGFAARRSAVKARYYGEKGEADVDLVFAMLGAVLAVAVVALLGGWLASHWHELGSCAALLPLSRYRLQGTGEPLTLVAGEEILDADHDPVSGTATLVIQGNGITSPITVDLVCGPDLGPIRDYARSMVAADGAWEPIAVRSMDDHELTAAVREVTGDGLGTAYRGHLCDLSLEAEEIAAYSAQGREIDPTAPILSCADASRGYVSTSDLGSMLAHLHQCSGMDEVTLRAVGRWIHGALPTGEHAGFVDDATMSGLDLGI